MISYLNYSRYGLREIRRHGEAASVDLEAVLHEQARLAEVISQY